MTLRLKLLIAIALAVFAAIHLAAAYKVEAASAAQRPDIISLQRD
jgi:hypothetical protein